MTLRLRHTANVTLKIDDDKQEYDVLLFEVLQIDQDEQGKFRLQFLAVERLCEVSVQGGVLQSGPFWPAQGH